MVGVSLISCRALGGGGLPAVGFDVLVIGLRIARGVARTVVGCGAVGPAIEVVASVSRRRRAAGEAADAPTAVDR